MARELGSLLMLQNMYTDTCPPIYRESSSESIVSDAEDEVDESECSDAGLKHWSEALRAATFAQGSSECDSQCEPSLASSFMSGATSSTATPTSSPLASPRVELKQKAHEASQILKDLLHSAQDQCRSSRRKIAASQKSLLHSAQDQYRLSRRSLTASVKPSVQQPHGAKIRGVLLLTGKLEESSDELRRAVRTALLAVLRPVVSHGITISVKQHGGGYKDLLARAVPRSGAKGHVRSSFKVSLTDRSDEAPVMEVLRLEAAFAGARHLLPALADLLGLSGRLAVRLEVEQCEDNEVAERLALEQSAETELADASCDSSNCNI